MVDLDKTSFGQQEDAYDALARKSHEAWATQTRRKIYAGDWTEAHMQRSREAWDRMIKKRAADVMAEHPDPVMRKVPESVLSAREIPVVKSNSGPLGIGPDAPVVSNENGAKQSKLDYRFDLIPQRAMFRLARVLDYGAKKYAPDNWRGIALHDHLNHVAVHLYAYLSGDTSDDHLGHMLCRAAMAVETAEAEGYAAKQGDES
jgi:hypothetical protein